MKVFTVIFIITVVATLLMFSRTFDGKHFSAVRYSVSFLLLIVLCLEGIAVLIFVFLNDSFPAGAAELSAKKYFAI